MTRIGVADAAEQLGVSPQRVRAMISARQLDAESVAGRWFIEVASLPLRRRQAGQPYSSRIAWAVIGLAEGELTGLLSPSERSRVRGRLRKLIDDSDAVASLPALLARRGRKMRLSASEPDGLLEDGRFVPSGRSDPRSGMSVANYAEGYVRERDLGAVEREHLLVPAEGAENVTVRVVPEEAGAPLARSTAPWLAVATDLAEGGARERQQAQQLWDDWIPRRDGDQRG